LPLTSLDWADLVALIGRANRAVARFDGIIQGMVDPGVLLAPLATQEAVLSSRIEGIQASLQDVLEFDAAPSASAEKYLDIQEVVNYRRAMAAAVELLQTRPICLNLLKEIHAILLDSVRGQDKRRGEFRCVQNYIGRPRADIDYTCSP
jgi:Fic family protein